MMIDLETLNLEELVQELKKIGTLDDRMERSKEVEAVKAAFYKELSKQKAEASSEEETSFIDIEEAFKSIYNDYKKERSEYNKAVEAERLSNLEIKQGLISQLKDLVSNADEVQVAFPVVKEIQTKWKETGPVPASDFRNVNESYQHQMELFYDKVKIGQELRDLDFKKNLEAKETLCVQAEELAGSENVVEAFKALQKLHEQWKEIGPVAKEFRESIWDRFKIATGVVNKRYQDHFEQIKANFSANLQAKEALCVEVEAIAAKEDIKDANQWNALSKEIEQVQAKWKTIGFASRKDNQKIYDRFRAACDKFYEKKRVYFTNIKDSMEANIAKKEALIAQAEQLKLSQEWKKATDQFISLQKQWKEIGAVPRKKSDQLWKRFRAACDEFFASRDANATSQNDYYSNLKAKKALIAEVLAYKPEEGVSSDSAKAEFNRRFKEIGFVPFKEKENIAQAFKEAMNTTFPTVLGRNDLIRKYNSLQQDIVTYENNIGFFSNSKNSEALISQMQQRIEQAKAELKKIEEQIRSQK